LHAGQGWHRIVEEARACGDFEQAKLLKKKREAQEEESLLDE
jgi:hypothetical protein